MKTQEQTAVEINPPIAPLPPKEYFLQECESDIHNFKNIGFFLDYMETQVELLPQMLENDPEDKNIDRAFDGMEFMIAEMRLFLDGHIDRTLGSLNDYVRGKRCWE